MTPCTTMHSQKSCINTSVDTSKASIASHGRQSSEYSSVITKRCDRIQQESSHRDFFGGERQAVSKQQSFQYEMNPTTPTHQGSMVTPVKEDQKLMVNLQYMFQ